MTTAIDVMGGDCAPGPTAEGTLSGPVICQAELVLVGNEPVVRLALESR
ncbi:hypothetical protein SBDP1_590008 [Syntrophobacter sp. SbD1]|nr:hypothetical protein SBDP1_590008 [Syntrophobacter sp. SbD1]